MTSNREKAAEVIDRLRAEGKGSYLTALELADAGLLAPDLPDPDLDNRDPVHRAEFESWWGEGPVPSVWNQNLPGGFMVQVFPDRPEVQMSEDGEPMEPFSPRDARALALALLAAANHAEEEE